MTLEEVMRVDKDGSSDAAKALSTDDIRQLVAWLSEKEDAIRYPSLLILQGRSRMADDVYPYRETFRDKLKSENSFQRNIGAIMIAENARWDGGWLDDVIEEYLALAGDEKPITVRMCVQSLAKIVPYKPGLHDIIAGRLMALSLSGIRESMRKLVLIDILEILAMIRGKRTNDAIESYIMDAMAGGLLDRKAKTRIEGLLKNGRQ
jgi:hypothetical protein